MLADRKSRESAGLLLGLLHMLMAGRQAKLPVSQTEVHLEGKALWWQFNTSYQPKPTECLVLLVCLFTTYLFNKPSIIWIVYSGLEVTPVC